MAPDTGHACGGTCSGWMVAVAGVVGTHKRTAQHPRGGTCKPMRTNRHIRSCGEHCCVTVAAVFVHVCVVLFAVCLGGFAVLGCCCVCACVCCAVCCMVECCLQLASQAEHIASLRVFEYDCSAAIRSANEGNKQIQVTTD